MCLLNMQFISITFQNLNYQGKLQTISAQKVSTLVDLEATMNKSNKSLKQMKEIMNLNGSKLLKIIYMHEKDILKNSK